MSIETVQAKLKSAGFDPGPVDGVFGARTATALDRALGAARAAAAASVDEDPNDGLLAEELLRDEGFVPHAYQDSKGFWTIGIGRLVDRRKGGGISRDEALYLKRNDIARFKRELDQKAPWWRRLDAVRQRVILNMTFNMGSGWVDTFTNTVAHIRAARWDEAAAGMLASQWSEDVGARAQRLAKMMRTGSAL